MSDANRLIRNQFVPLAASWLLMSLETPICSSIISRTPNQNPQLAGLLVMMSISLWIESPVIDLLSTSTTLAAGKQSLLTLRRFSLWMMLLCTVVHVGFCLGPFYDLYMSKVLHAPQQVIDICRLPLITMIPWSASIGWRRWLHGLLIRARQTKAIGIGTFIRLISVTTTGLVLLHFTEWTGLQIAATALVSSVFVEAVFIHYAARKIVREMMNSDDSEKNLALKEILTFHYPLTFSTMVVMTTQPLVGMALFHVFNPIVQSAAWQLALTIASPLRSVTAALVELTIVFAGVSTENSAMKWFSLRVGIWCSGLLLFVRLSNLDLWIFRSVITAKPEVIDVAHTGLLVCCALPLVSAVLCYIRGRLTALRANSYRLISITFGLLGIGITLFVGLNQHWSGFILAPIAVLNGMLLDLGSQMWFLVRLRQISPRMA